MVMGLTSSEAIALNEFHKNIGNNIHKARIKRKITIEKLSILSGLSTKTIEKYEMGSRQMSFEVLMKLAGILKSKIEDFFKE